MKPLTKQDSWVSTPQLKNMQQERLLESLSNELLQTVLAVIQDGICILDKEYNIIYSNPVIDCWYSDDAHIAGHKCYDVYHQRKSPCEVCPTMRSLESKTPQTDIVRYESKKGQGGWQKLFCVPILDSSNEAVIAIEYIRDITGQRNAELSSEFIENQNLILMSVLEQKQKEKETMEQTIAANMEQCMKPMLNYLGKILDKDSMNRIKQQMDISIQGVTRKKLPMAERLTPREIQITAMIKDNYLSKEIADQLMISKKAVDYHRTNIRRKLNLKPDDNLQSFIKMNL
ncbi:MAG: LuxR C-terminal-related transcriptional regulator [Lacrimispora sp.]